MQKSDTVAASADVSFLHINVKVDSQQLCPNPLKSRSRYIPKLGIAPFKISMSHTALWEGNPYLDLPKLLTIKPPLVHTCLILPFMANLNSKFYPFQWSNVEIVQIIGNLIQMCQLSSLLGHHIWMSPSWNTVPVYDCRFIASWEWSRQIRPKWGRLMFEEIEVA